MRWGKWKNKTNNKNFLKSRHTGLELNPQNHYRFQTPGQSLGLPGTKSITAIKDTRQEVLTWIFDLNKSHIFYLIFKNYLCFFINYFLKLYNLFVIYTAVRCDPFKCTTFVFQLYYYYYPQSVRSTWFVVVKLVSGMWQYVHGLLQGCQCLG